MLPPTPVRPHTPESPPTVTSLSRMRTLEDSPPDTVFEKFPEPNHDESVLIESLKAEHRTSMPAFLRRETIISESILAFHPNDDRQLRAFTTLAPDLV